MNTNTLKELAIVAVLIVLSVLVANPTKMWMPMLGEALLVAGIVLAVGIFATLYWREHASDEREAQLRMQADRIAFLLGSVVLVAGIVFEFITMHYANPWLLGALCIMVAAKSFTNVYNNY